jgi:3-isopropylmalate/(R)-2-methylmalate dehydratase small subunit
VEAFTTHTGTAVPLRRSSVDTDQIIPAEYLKRITRTGFHDGLFAAWKADPEFTLNRVEHRGASILVAGSDFGTGSSREHAVWALLDGGFRVVVSSRFGDIFCSNAGKSGLLTAQVHSDAVEELWRRVEEEPSTLVTVDLNKRQISTPLGFRASFEIDDYTRWRLLEGLDDVDVTLSQAHEISAHEDARPPWHPRTLPAQTGEVGVW